MTKPYDLKNDPKFLARVKKLEGNNYAKVLKDPVELTIAERKALVVCLGQNDSYLVVEPHWLGDDNHAPPDWCFSVFWTKSDQFQKPSPLHDQVSNQMINWLMIHSNGDSDFDKVRHGSFTLESISIKALAAKYGESYFQNEKELEALLQGTLVEGIQNPFHK